MLIVIIQNYESSESEAFNNTDSEKMAESASTCSQMMLIASILFTWPPTYSKERTLDPLVNGGTMMISLQLDSHSSSFSPKEKLMLTGEGCWLFNIQL